jgi:hypothetical protein
VKKGKPMTLKEANEIVEATLKGHLHVRGLPVVTLSGVRGTWSLTDGNHCETARRSPDELRAQCHHWLAKMT